MEIYMIAELNKNKEDAKPIAIFFDEIYATALEDHLDVFSEMFKIDIDDIIIIKDGDWYNHKGIAMMKLKEEMK